MPDSASAAALILLFACSASAAELAVDFDPAKTHISWTLTGNVHTVHGSFHLTKGHVVIDAATGAITGDLLVDARSGESGNTARDKHMHKEILESEQFPDIRFAPKKVDGAVSPSGHSTVRVSGTFLIHGEAHDVTVPMEISVAGTAVTATGKFSVPYVDWGMKDPSNFLFKVDKSVDVEIVAAGSGAER